MFHFPLTRIQFMSGIKQTYHIGCENVGQRIPNVSSWKVYNITTHKFIDIYQKNRFVLRYRIHKTYLSKLFMCYRNRNELIFPSMIRFGSYGRAHKIDIWMYGLWYIGSGSINLRLCALILKRVNRKSLNFYYASPHLWL